LQGDSVDIAVDGFFGVGVDVGGGVGDLPKQATPKHENAAGHWDLGKANLEKNQPAIIELDLGRESCHYRMDRSTPKVRGRTVVNAFLFQFYKY
jgi:hypothetical protein